jgi:dihydroorotate dehydrogenase
MTALIASAALPFLRRIDPERAHNLALTALRLGLAGRDTSADDPRLAVRLPGMTFRSPIGLAAGFDKNAVALAPLARLGFGFIEAGTVTPRPQSGNPRPRLFRLPEDRAIINRMGFNNAGIDAFVRRLAAFPRGLVPVGANVGINKEGADPEHDYAALIAAVGPHADYVVINVSSPNTPGLRDLQAEARLRSILQAISETVPKRPPLFVKISPDLSNEGIASVVETSIAGGAQGLIVSNTTITRPAGLRSVQARETGGLSGAPLFALSTDVLRQAARQSAGRLVLIGVGGIASGSDVLQKLRAGASLVQLYTAFAYEGPALTARLKRELLTAMDREGFGNVHDAIGTGLK